ncbi:pickpocket protein 19-like isoform X2 [Zootermopsis nevadensis]|nr:pickpocket protein 19-like isoform X2 [Zootermopsis nevadensis]XP_021939068.1 pickpocket protein 19-like isoform X2 [Zootermopsis nevadensis]
MKVVGLNSKESQRNKKAKHPTKRSPCQMVRCGFILHFLRDYFINSSLHGLRYVAEDGRHWAERCIWIFLCTIAVAGALYTSSNIWTRYQTSPTMTVLESTNYQIEYLPFPAVTVCNVYHARWDKAVRFQETYLPDADNITINAFYRLVFGLSLVNFGDFDMITKYFGNSIEDAERLAGLNVTFLMMEVMSSCEELFVEKCWWRNMFYDCCSLFEMQKTEYGFCYSFNSETSQYRRS